MDISLDATLEDQIAEILGTNEVDSAVDAVGFEASGHGRNGGEAPAAVLNSIMSLTRAGGRLGIPEAPRGYQEFDCGVARKYVLDPHGLIPAA